MSKTKESPWTMESLDHKVTLNGHSGIITKCLVLKWIYWWHMMCTFDQEKRSAQVIWVLSVVSQCSRYPQTWNRMPHHQTRLLRSNCIDFSPICPRELKLKKLIWWINWCQDLPWIHHPRSPPIQRSEATLMEVLQVNPIFFLTSVLHPHILRHRLSFRQGHIISIADIIPHFQKICFGDLQDQAVLQLYVHHFNWIFNQMLDEAGF